jgi:hypothetical protein
MSQQENDRVSSRRNRDACPTAPPSVTGIIAPDF